MQEEIVMSKRIRATARAAHLTLRLVLLGSFAMTTPLFSQSGAPMDHSAATQAPPELVQVVREATQKYTDVNAAINAGYHPILGCVSGPDHGAMGVHYVNASLLNGEVDATQPQALIYEPLGGGKMQLVGVEFIVDASTWAKEESRSAGTLSATVSVDCQPKQIRPEHVLRIACVGMAGQSKWRIRGLE